MRFLYAVMGNTHGHIMRSLAIAERLAAQGHEFHFVGGGRVLEDLAGRFPCLEVPVLRTAAHHRGRVSVRKAAGQIGARVLEVPKVAAQIRALIEAWHPDLALCDREFFTPFACERTGLPCVGVDHSKLLVACDYEVPAAQRWEWRLAYWSDRALFDRTKHNLIVSCYHPPLKPERARRGYTDELLPPVLRPAVTEITPSEGEKIFCYQTSATSRVIVDALAGSAREAVVYGFPVERDTREGRVTFRPFDARRLLEDLASSAFAVINGGHNVLCEALHYGKPVLCCPVPMLFEQFLNAWHVRAAGWGDFVTRLRLTPELLATFEHRLAEYRAKFAGKKFDGTAEVVRRVEILAKEMSAKRST